MEQLYVIVHKTDGIIYALGNSQTSAWDNAYCVCHNGIPGSWELDTFNRVSQWRVSQRKKGWRAKKIKIEVIS